MIYMETVGTKAPGKYLADKELLWGESENSPQLQQRSWPVIINKGHGRIPRSPDIRDQMTGVPDLSAARASNSHLLITAVKTRGG